MSKLYKIKGWSRLFETAETRKLRRLSWVPVPNKHDGKGYRRILRLQEGPLVYAGWLLILQVASKCPVRGTLADDDGPLTAEDLADKTGFPVEYFQKALNALTRPEIGWLECDGSTGDILEQQEIILEQQEIILEQQGGREGKGREGNRREITTMSADVNSVNSVNTPEQPKKPKRKPEASVIALEIYEAYPKKVGRGAALKAIQNAIDRGNTPESILDATKAYAKSALVKTTESQFLPHAATWFNQDRFLDDRKNWTARSIGNGNTNFRPAGGTDDEDEDLSFLDISDISDDDNGEEWVKDTPEQEAAWLEEKKIRDAEDKILAVAYEKRLAKQAGKR